MKKIIVWVLTLAMTISTWSVTALAEDMTEFSQPDTEEFSVFSVSNGSEVSEDTTDNLDDFSKVYSSDNLTLSTTNVLSEGNGIFTITDNTQAGNVVYKAIDGKSFGTVSIQIMKHWSVSIKYPVISYSNDDEIYTPLTTVMSETGANPAEWVRSQNSINDYWLYNCSVAMPDDANYVKIELPENSTPSGEAYKYKLDKVELSMALEPAEVSDNLVDECDELINLWSSENMVQGDASGFGDDTTWRPGNAAQKSEVVYKAASGKSISKIVVNITRAGTGAKFPIIAYSTDGENYINITEVMSDIGYSADGWVRDANLGGNDAAHNYQWPARATVELPVGAIYVKLWIQAASGDIWIEDITLDVGKSGVLSDELYSETFESLDYVHRSKNITLNNGTFDAVADGELCYMVVPGRGADSIEITVENDGNVNNVTVHALNSAEKEISAVELTENWNENFCTISGSLPEGTRYVVLKNSDAVTYSAINITTKTADTYSWVSVTDTPSFTMGEDGTMTASANVKNDSGVTMRVSGYHLVYSESGELLRIESDVNDVPSGKTETVSVPSSDYNESYTSKLLLLSDIENSVAIGSAAMPLESAVSEPVIDYRFSDIEKGEITIMGEGLPVSKQDNKVAVIVLNPTYTRTNADNEIADTAINNMTIGEVNADGSFAVNMRLRNPVYGKTYNVVVRSTAMLSADDSLSVTYTEPNVLATNIAAKIREGDKAGLQALLVSGNIKIIGIRISELNNITVDALCTLFGGKPDTSVQNTIESVRHSLESRALIDMIKSGNAENLIKKAFSDNDCLDILTAGETTSASAKVFRTLSDGEAIASALNGNIYSDMNSLKNAFALAVLNEAIKGSQTNLKARAVMEEYRLGAMFTTNYIDAYNALNNANRAKAENALIASAKSKAFISVDDAAQRFKDLIDDAAYDGSGGGGSKSSGGSKKTSGSIKVEPAILEQVKSEKTENKPFMDIDDVPWAEEGILALFNKGVISGRARLIFEPHSLVTREEYVKMVVLALGIKTESPECSFDDVLINDWFYTYVSEAYTAGIINGVTELFFGSGSDITREEMAAILYRAAEFKCVKLNDGTLEFDDKSNISDYAKKPIAALYAAGVINGMGNNYFNPKATATRAEAAKIIYTLIKNSGI